MILIYRRGNFGYCHRRCTFIFHIVLSLKIPGLYIESPIVSIYLLVAPQVPPLAQYLIHDNFPSPSIKTKLGHTPHPSRFKLKHVYLCIFNEKKIIQKNSLFIIVRRFLIYFNYPYWKMVYYDLNFAGLFFLYFCYARPYLR